MRIPIAIAMATVALLPAHADGPAGFVPMPAYLDQATPSGATGTQDGPQPSSSVLDKIDFLTDAQRDQIQEVCQRYPKPRYPHMRKLMVAEIMAILTPEQRAQVKDILRQKRKRNLPGDDYDALPGPTMPIE